MWQEVTQLCKLRRIVKATMQEQLLNTTLHYERYLLLAVLHRYHPP